MDLLALYTIWLTAFSISFTFLPLLVVMDWRRRGSADGFSSVNFVLPMLMMGCWCKHGVLTEDRLNIFINTVNLIFFVAYISAFAYYQPKRTYLYGQLAMLVVTIIGLFRYVDSHPTPEQADKMGAIAATTQIISLAGGVYDIKRAVDLKTMEYVPASIQFGIFALTTQWLIFGIIINNIYMSIANGAGLAVNIVTLILYFVYPPKTWRVPIFGVGGTAASVTKAKKSRVNGTHSLCDRSPAYDCLSDKSFDFYRLFTKFVLNYSKNIHQLLFSQKAADKCNSVVHRAVKSVLVYVKGTSVNRCACFQHFDSLIFIHNENKFALKCIEALITRLQYDQL